MSNYAVIRNSQVINVIVAESQEIAESVTESDVVKTTGVPWIGWTLEAEGWRSPAPFPSWRWDGSAWQAPIPYPEDGLTYSWDEDATEWIATPTDESPLSDDVSASVTE